MSDREYDVGYGRPPKHTQFQKGQSGNPKGRKKGARGIKTDLRAELSERVEITENGKKVRLTKQRLVLKQLGAKAAKGDVRAIDKLVDLAISLLGPDDETQTSAAALPKEDKEILDRFVDRKIEDLLDDE